MTKWGSVFEILKFIYAELTLWAPGKYLRTFHFTRAKEKLQIINVKKRKSRKDEQIANNFTTNAYLQANRSSPVSSARFDSLLK